MDAKDELPNVPGLPPQPVPPAPAATPQNPVWIPQGPQVHTLAQLQSLLQYQQIYQASPWQQQMVIHIVCLTQRAEEHVFDKKIEVQRASKELLKLLKSLITLLPFTTCLVSSSGGASWRMSCPWMKCRAPVKRVSLFVISALRSPD